THGCVPRYPSDPRFLVVWKRTRLRGCGGQASEELQGVVDGRHRHDLDVLAGRGQGRLVVAFGHEHVLGAGCFGSHDLLADPADVPDVAVDVHRPRAG